MILIRATVGGGHRRFVGPSKKLARCFESLERDPRSGNNVNALKRDFDGGYRYRRGDLCVVYTINDRAVIVFGIAIAKRSDVLRLATLSTLQRASGMLPRACQALDLLHQLRARSSSAPYFGYARRDRE